MLIILVAVTAGVGPARAETRSITLPPEIAAFPPGPNVDAAESHCLTCHSAEYVLTQPPKLKRSKDFWRAEVTKMVKVFGAPIEDGVAARIIDYLVSTP